MKVRAVLAGRSEGHSIHHAAVLPIAIPTPDHYAGREALAEDFIDVYALTK